MYTATNRVFEYKKSRRWIIPFYGRSSIGLRWKMPEFWLKYLKRGPMKNFKFGVKELLCVQHTVKIVTVSKLTSSVGLGSVVVPEIFIFRLDFSALFVLQFIVSTWLFIPTLNGYHFILQLSFQWSHFYLLCGPCLSKVRCICLLHPFISLRFSSGIRSEIHFELCLLWFDNWIYIRVWVRVLDWTFFCWILVFIRLISLKESNSLWKIRIPFYIFKKFWLQKCYYLNVDHSV